MKTVAIVAVREGSKGIPYKGMSMLCDKPLVDWTLIQLKNCPEIESVWVISDSKAILARAFHYGCNQIVEPWELAEDNSRLEDVWLYALQHIEKVIGKVDLIVAPQVTSPLRESSDFSKAVEQFYTSGCDSLFSASPAKDLCLWTMYEGTNPKPEFAECLDPNRKRQNFTKRIIENGSFYLFKPDVLRVLGLRFGGDTDVYLMPYWKMFEIDEPEDLVLCNITMKAHLEGKLK